MRRRQAARAGEGYADKLVRLENEPEPFGHERLPPAAIAMLPLVLVFVLNYVFTQTIPGLYGAPTRSRSATPSRCRSKSVKSWQSGR